MYFSISPTQLDRTITAVIPYLDPSDRLITIEADDSTSRLKISGGGTHGFSTIFVDAKITTNGTVTVNGELLSKLVRTYSGGQVNVRLDLTGTRLQLSAISTFPKNATVSLGIVSGRVVAIPSLNVNQSVSIDIAKFVQAISSLKALKSSANVTGITNNAVRIFFGSNKVQLAMQSMRGIVVSTIDYDGGFLLQNQSEIIVPLDILAHLPVTEDKEIVIKDAGQLAVFSTNLWEIISPTMTFPFANYGSILAAGITSQLNLNTRDILPILRRANLLMDTQGAINKSVVFNVDADHLEISLNSKKGEYSDHLPCCQLGLSGSIGFLVDDLISSVLAANSDAIVLQWKGQAVTVTVDNPNLGDVVTTCIIKTVSVVAVPPQQVMATTPDVDIDIEATDINKLRDLAKSMYGGNNNGTVDESTNEETDGTSEGITYSTDFATCSQGETCSEGETDLDETSGGEFYEDGTSGQDRESYSDDQDRDSYTVSTGDMCTNCGDCGENCSCNDGEEDTDEITEIFQGIILDQTAAAASDN